MSYTYSEIVDLLDYKHYSSPEGVGEGIQTWRGLELSAAARVLRVKESVILSAMQKVAKRYPLRSGESRCKSCGMPMRFVENVPYDREGYNHFVSCPNRKAHRKK